jgi:hypothetical protein
MPAAKITFFLAVVALSPLSAFAQSAIPDGPPPALGPPPLAGAGPAQLNGASPPPPLPATGTLPSTSPGSNQVSDDEISTKRVKAAPCGTAARETDGVTTCIGIQDNQKRTRKSR